MMNLTDEKIIEMAVDHLGICYDRMPHGVLMFARALLATPPAAALAPVAKPYRYSAFENFTVREVSPTPSTPAPKNCQTGWADFCKASQHDGVACPADSCDIDDGVRKDHAPSTPAPVASEHCKCNRPYHDLDCPIAIKAMSAAPPTRPGADDDLVELLRSIRTEFGAVGSRDVDVRAQQQRIDKAIAMLAPQPSEKEDQVIAAKQQGDAS